jgi:hypothetical protein
MKGRGMINDILTKARILGDKEAAALMLTRSVRPSPKRKKARKNRKAFRAKRVVCEKCGAIISDKFEHCSSCGTGVSLSAPTPAQFKSRRQAEMAKLSRRAKRQRQYDKYQKREEKARRKRDSAQIVTAYANSPDPAEREIAAKAMASGVLLK